MSQQCKQRHAGLINVNETCYLSATVQALFHCPQFTSLIATHKCCAQSTLCVVCSLQELHSEMGKKKVVVPTQLVQLLPVYWQTFQVGIQQDAHEYLVTLLDQMKEASFTECQPALLDHNFGPPTADVTTTFGGVMEIKDVCSLCDCEMVESPPFLYLCVPLPNNIGSLQMAVSSLLSESEAIKSRCPCCEQVSHRTRRESISVYPKNLIVVLRRFVVEENLSRRKITENVEVNSTLQVSKGVYKFMSGVLHLGDNLTGGHYISLSMCPDGSFTKFNDSAVWTNCVSELKSGLVQRGMYIAFFKLEEVKDDKPALGSSMGKRSMPPSPTKASPPNKKRPALPNKTQIVRPPAAPPLQTILNTAKSAAAGKCVPPLRSILKTAKEARLSALNEQISKDVFVRFSDEPPPPPRVPPLKVLRSLKNRPKVSSDESNHDYGILKDTLLTSNEPPPPPVKRVSPLTILRSLNKNKVKVSSEESVHDYQILKETITGPTKVSAAIEPIEPIEPSAPIILHYKPVILTPADVPGAILPKSSIADNSKKALLRWLASRGLNLKGKKKFLSRRVQNCISIRRDHVIDSKIDGGKWYDLKKAKIYAAGDQISLDIESIYPPGEWDPFPSSNLPTTFNFGSIYHWLIESAPQFEGDFDLLSEDSDDDYVSESSDGVHNLKSTEVEICSSNKPMRRGILFVKSKFVRNIRDIVEEGTHYIKAQVHASMHSVAYQVHVGISNLSGVVYNAQCDKKCKVNALGRCAHVGALLLHVLTHTRINGFQAITSTSKSCEWNIGSLKRDPGLVLEKTYDSFKLNVQRRSSFDPRPEFAQIESKRRINDFLAALSGRDPLPLWSIIMEIKYDQPQYEEEDFECFRNNREQLLEAIKLQIENLREESCPYVEFPGTVYQSTGDEWFTARSLFVTASKAKELSNMESLNSKRSYLQNHLWCQKGRVTRAMRYGLKSEDIARESYIDLIREDIDPCASVRRLGLIANPLSLGLACSPDGLLVTDTDTKLLEIKCPYTLRNRDPKEFDKVLSTKQLKNCSFKRNKDGIIVLKEEHPYYDQVQMAMGIMQLKKCDFYVWSKEGYILMDVDFDCVKWESLREKLTAFHRNILVPEYFTMLTPRNLFPVELL